MSSFTVHMIPGSPAARAVMVTLTEKGAEFRVAALTPEWAPLIRGRSNLAE